MNTGPETSMNRLFMVLPALTVLLLGCGESTSASTGQSTSTPVETQDYDAQIEEYNKQQKVVALQLEEAERQLVRQKALLEASEELAARQLALTAKSEQQAKRYDAILDKWERQAARADAAR